MLKITKNCKNVFEKIYDDTISVYLSPENFLKRVLLNFIQCQFGTRKNSFVVKRLQKNNQKLGKLAPLSLCKIRLKCANHFLVTNNSTIDLWLPLW